LHRGPNRAAAHDLAKGTDGTGILDGVQVAPTVVPHLAHRSDFGVVVKDFGAKEVDLTGEKHARKQGQRPVLVPIFSTASHLAIVNNK
jgi:hypothetical protein